MSAPKYTLKTKSHQLCEAHGDFDDHLIEQFDGAPIWRGCPRCHFDAKNSPDESVSQTAKLVQAGSVPYAAITDVSRQAVMGHSAGGHLAAMGPPAGALLAYLALRKLTGHEILVEHGPLMLASALLLISGLLMFTTGLLGELVMRTYFESQGRRIYAIREILSRREPPVKH